ncbi:MAG TPA: glycoside hydrolase family 3 C-terminal domain-containing protein, partial [Vicinamibacterales bacterium]|nr:glycoside hydrolase family 3 C-terminal domain-containing protein [Vicinamibacterales bacterium]
PVVLVITGGSALAVNWADAHVAAILDVWYGGAEIGTALGEVLAGACVPSGRLPLTFYESVQQLPAFIEYAMAGRTYRYFEGEPLYRFGYGLSYSTFAYGGLRAPEAVQAGASVDVTVSVTNAGTRAAHEVAQLYVSNLDAAVPVTIRQLAGFARIHLEAGETRVMNFTIAPPALSVIDDDAKRRVHPGRFRITAGGSQPGDTKAASRGVATPLAAEIALTGDPIEIER